MKTPPRHDGQTAVELAADLCRASGSPSLLLLADAVRPLACSPAYAQRTALSETLEQRSDWADVRAAVENVVRSGIPGELELKGGSLVEGLIRLHLAPVMGNGEVEAVMVWLDGPRLAEEEVRASAAQALAAKSRFLAAASHDLRQPFQAMRFFHSVLADHAVAPAARRASDMLGAALEAGERLLSALLDISTLDAGTVHVQTERVHLGQLVEQVVAEYRPEAEAKGLRMRVHSRDLHVDTDPVLLGRIIRNILVNAVHYTRRGGVLVAVRSRDGRALVEVWDTGFGIPEQQIADIFEEFHQLENPERDPSRGLGLGLAIVRRLARMLSIPVKVHSRLGRGSVFSLSLPLAETPVEASAQSDGGEQMSVTKRSILVVEDDPMVLMGLQMILETWGMEVLPAEDMSQVLERLDQGQPDLILSDLRLRAGLTGFEVVERVRQVLDREVPAIILTGETGKAELAEGQRRNLTFLHKPIQAEPLKAAIGAAAP